MQSCHGDIIERVALLLADVPYIFIIVNKFTFKSASTLNLKSDTEASNVFSPFGMPKLSLAR